MDINNMYHFNTGKVVMCEVPAYLPSFSTVYRLNNSDALIMKDLDTISKNKALFLNGGFNYPLVLEAEGLLSSAQVISFIDNHIDFLVKHYTGLIDEKGIVLERQTIIDRVCYVFEGVYKLTTYADIIECMYLNMIKKYKIKNLITLRASMFSTIENGGSDETARLIKAIKGGIYLADIYDVQDQDITPRGMFEKGLDISVSGEYGAKSELSHLHFDIINPDWHTEMLPEKEILQVAKPKLFGIIDLSYLSGAAIHAMVIDNQGNILSNHYCSTLAFAKHDLGFSETPVKEATDNWLRSRDIYISENPNGYFLEWVGKPVENTYPMELYKQAKEKERLKFLED